MHLKNKLAEGHIWSNALYLIPMMYAFLLNEITLAILILLVSLFSFLHHITKKTEKYEWWWKKHTMGTYNLFFSIIDLSLTLILFFYMFRIFLVSAYSSAHLVLIVAFTITSLLFLGEKFKLSYNEQNALWHLFSALTILLVLI